MEDDEDILENGEPHEELNNDKDEEEESGILDAPSQKERRWRVEMRERIEKKRPQKQKLRKQTKENKQKKSGKV